VLEFGHVPWVLSVACGAVAADLPQWRRHHAAAAAAAVVVVVASAWEHRRRWQAAASRRAAKITAGSSWAEPLTFDSDDEATGSLFSTPWASGSSLAPAPWMEAEPDRRIRQICLMIQPEMTPHGLEVLVFCQETVLKDCPKARSGGAALAAQWSTKSGRVAHCKMVCVIHLENGYLTVIALLSPYFGGETGGNGKWSGSWSGRTDVNGGKEQIFRTLVHHMTAVRGGNELCDPPHYKLLNDWYAGLRATGLI
jgi:hypothetical protein